MMVFLIILAAIICLCVGFVSGLLVFLFAKEEIEQIKPKRASDSTYTKELKNFFNYDGTNQE
ncbi:MAG: hypothetical protein J6Q67_03295 [Clostridia bacterium]|nr:hypothetical protein [Clostridia bacterium]